MNYLVVDFEMSGDDPTWHEIIQVGAVMYSPDWKELGRYESNVYPENEESFSQPSAEVHGLSLKDLEDAPMMNEILPAFEEWILSCKGIKPDPFDNSRLLRNTMLAGLGLVNDYSFFRAAYRYENRKWPYSYRMVDMQTLTHSLFPVFRKAGLEVPKKQSLNAIAAFFGYEREGYDHNALEDAVMTGDCFRKLSQLISQLDLNDV